MKIRKLHIYSFGHFEDLMIDDISSEIQVIHGANEAGKSTIMAFIRGVLFGFTTKKKDYTPIGGGSAGGSLTIETDQGIVTIERTGAKGKGNAKLFFDNGTTGGEESLQTLLRGLDLPMFDAIFSFDLEGLQGLERIEADELNDYLFHAGMTGSLSIRELEKKLQKQEAELFKPSGRKPVLNQFIAELQEEEKELRKWEQQNDRYQRILDELASMRERVQEIEDLKQKHNRQIRELEKRETIRPLVEDRQMWMSRLKQLPNYEDFPEDGLARFEKWQSQAVALQAEKAQLEKKETELRRRLEALNPNQSLLSKKEDLLQLKEEQRWAEEQNNQTISLHQELQSEEEELQILFENLGSMWTEAKVIDADTGITAKENLKTLMKQKERLTEQQKILDDELTRLEQTVQHHKQNEQQLNGRLLSEVSRLSMEEQVIEDEKNAYIQIEKNQLEKQLDGLRSAQKQRKQKTGGAHKVFFYGMTALGTALCIWTLSIGMPILAVATALLFSGFGFYIIRLNQSSASNRAELISEIETNLAHLNEQLRENSTAGELETIKKRLAEDDTLRQEHVILKERLRQDQQVYENALARYEKLQKSLMMTEETVKGWCRNHGFPEDINLSQLLDMFHGVSEAKGRIRRRNRIKENADTIESALQHWKDQIKQFCDMFQISSGQPVSAIHLLVQRLNLEEHTRKERQQLNTSMDSLNEQVTSLTDKILYYDKECLKLMEQAGVENEEAFRRMAKAWHESRGILEHLQSVNSRLESLLPDELVRNSMIRESLKEESNEQSGIAQLEEQNRVLTEEESTLNKSIAELQTEKAKLEEGGTHAELLHRFQLKKDQFEQAARRWSVYKTASQILKQAKEQYRNERQPKVIKLAQQYLAAMTEQRFQKLFAPDGEGFIIERYDGNRFSPGQLSRGTAEQLYLSLRLALAQIYESPSPYPVIMDDILVNFDRIRAEKATKMIREAAKHQQMLFFTCHHHMMEHFEEQEILMLDAQKAAPIRIRSSS